MNLFNEKQRILAEIEYLEKLINKMPDAFFLEKCSLSIRKKSLHNTLQEIEEQISKKETGCLATVKIVVEGPIVAKQENNWIETKFASEFLANYEKSVLAVERNKRQQDVKKGTKKPESGKLYISNVFQGSFGFELKEAPRPQQDLFDSYLQESIDLVNHTLAISSKEDSDVDTLIEEVGAKPLFAMRELLKVVHSANTSFSLHTRKQYLELNYEKVSRSFYTLSKLEKEESSEETIEGILFLSPVSKRFELKKATDGKFIVGKISKDITEEEIIEATGKKCIVTFDVSVVFYSGNISKVYRSLTKVSQIQS